MNIYKSPKSYEIPNLDVLTFLFDNPTSLALPETKLHIQASNPSNYITQNHARSLTQSIAFQFRKNYSIGSNGPGKDVVVVISSGQILLPVLFYSVIAAGGVYSAASASFTVSELERQIKHGEGRVVVCSEDCRDVAVGAARRCGIDRSRVLVMSSENSEKEWRIGSVDGGVSLLGGEGRLDWERVTDKRVLEERLVCLLYSSGTTGVPKGVELSHANMVSQCYIPATQAREVIDQRVAQGEPAFEYRTLAHLPASHIAGVQGYFINPFYMGGPTYWMSKFDFASFLLYNKTYRITFFFTVPPIYLLIAKSPTVTDQFDYAEVAISGAAPLGKELQYAASRKLGKGKCFIAQTWGLSETTGSVTGMPWGESDDSGSVSKLLPNMSIRLVDDDGKDVPEGQPGEILVKGPVVTKGYYGNAQATKDSFIDGWFCTGDVAIWKNGLPYIVDRKKELIKYKGLQVAPAELEALLLTNPKILDAAVIGVDIPSGTEAPRAYIVASPEEPRITEEEITKFVKENLASHKQLRGGVVFMEIIPKSPAGKILRKDLRELARRVGRAKL